MKTIMVRAKKDKPNIQKNKEYFAKDVGSHSYMVYSEKQIFEAYHKMDFEPVEQGSTQKEDANTKQTLFD